MSGEHVDMDIISKSCNFLDLHDEMLMKIVHSVAVDEDIFRFLANLNKTNKRLNTLVNFEMQTHGQYRQEVGNIKYFVPGTRIPCGVQRAPELPTAYTQTDILNIFYDSHTAAPNAVLVSQCFRLADEQTIREDLSLWEDVENVDHEHIPDQRAFFILIDLEFDAETYCQEHVVPVLHNDRADLSRIPNVFRTVLGFRMLTMDYDEMDAVLCDRVLYTRVVRVHANNTIQDVFNSIRATEGWKTLEPCYDFDAVLLNASILDLFEHATNNKMCVRPCIFWPSI